MMVQAYEYEVAERQRAGGGEGEGSGQRPLDRFYDSVEAVKDPRVRAVWDEIMQRRKRDGLGRGVGHEARSDHVDEGKDG